MPYAFFDVPPESDQVFAQARPKSPPPERRHSDALQAKLEERKLEVVYAAKGGGFALVDQEVGWVAKHARWAYYLTNGSWWFSAQGYKADSTPERFSMNELVRQIFFRDLPVHVRLYRRVGFELWDHRKIAYTALPVKHSAFDMRKDFPKDLTPIEQLLDVKVTNNAPNEVIDMAIEQLDKNSKIAAGLVPELKRVEAPKADESNVFSDGALLYQAPKNHHTTKWRRKT